MVTSIHEQARAEILERLGSEAEHGDGPRRVTAFVAGAEWAAHRERCPHQKCPGGSLCCCTDQAATRTRVVTTDPDAYRPVERFGAEGGRLLPARTGSVDTHTDTPGEDTRE